MKLNSQKAFLVFWFIGFSNSIFSQTSKAERIAFNKIPDSTKIAEIKSGKYLQFAYTRPIEDFIETIFRRGNNYMDKKDGHVKTEELYRDTAYTYFGNTSSENYIHPYYKVATTDLQGISFMEINGKEIKNKFIEEIIPLADKRKVAEKRRTYLVTTDESYYDIKYLKEEKALLVAYKWRITCPTCISRVVNKSYQAKFSLTNNQFFK